MASGFEHLANLVQHTTTRVLGRAVTFTPLEGDPIEDVPVVWDDAHSEVDPDTLLPVQTSQPVAGFKLADLPENAIARGARVLLEDGREFTVARWDFDGLGGVDVFLHDALDPEDLP